MDNTIQNSLGSLFDLQKKMRRAIWKWLDSMISRVSTVAGFRGGLGNHVPQASLLRNEPSDVKNTAQNLPRKSDNNDKIKKDVLMALAGPGAASLPVAAKFPQAEHRTWQGTKVNSASSVLNDNSRNTCTTCWIGAEHALNHARKNTASVSKVFDDFNIQKSEYVVLAGFDESLIKSGVAFLEQIHVFVHMEVDATSPLLSELGRLFSPFSSILFTESSSYRLPVFKGNGSVWDFNEFVFVTSLKFSDCGPSAKTPLVIISLSQTSRTADLDGPVSGSSQSKSGGGNPNRKQGSKEGEEEETGPEDENKVNSKDSKDSKDPPGGQDRTLSDISFEITSKLHHLISDSDEQSTSEIDLIQPNASESDSESNQDQHISSEPETEIDPNHPIQQNVSGSQINQDEKIKASFLKFQELTMHGRLTIETTSQVRSQDPALSRFSKRYLRFMKLKLQTKTPTNSGPGLLAAFKQDHLRIDVNSHQRNAEISDISPLQTSDSNREESRTTSKKSGWTGSIIASISASLLAGISFNASKGKEKTVSSETKHITSGISQFHGKGIIQWGINVDDVRLKNSGIDLEAWGTDTGRDVLPRACFEFLGDSKVPTLPESPPNFMDITITSFWTANFPKSTSGWLRKLRLRSTGDTNTLTYSNLIQIAALTVDLSNLQDRSVYKADMDVRPGATYPLTSHFDVHRDAATSVSITPINHGVDLPDLGFFNLPKTARFKLSEICMPPNLKTQEAK